MLKARRGIVFVRADIRKPPVQVELLVGRGARIASRMARNEQVAEIAGWLAASNIPVPLVDESTTRLLKVIED